MMKSVSKVYLFSRLIGATGLLLAVLVAPSFCADYPDTAVLRQMVEIQSELYNDLYEQARSACKSLITNNPTNPLPLLVMAGALVGESKEKEEDLYEKELFNLLDKAEELAKTYIQSPIDSVKAWAYLALGHTWASRSLWEARFGSTAQAYRRGKQAKAYYQKGLEADSTLYDLYAAMGEYNYWKSTKAGFLRSLGLIHNERQKGIDQVKLAVDSSLISNASAKRGLMWIYLDNKQYDSTIAIAELMHAEYPYGRVFVWALAQAYYHKEEYDKAIFYFKKMRLQINAPPENYHKLISVDHFLTTCYQALEETEKAWQTACLFTAYENNIPNYVYKEQKKKIKFLKKLAKSGAKQRAQESEK